MEYTVNLSINEQNLSVYQILSVNGTVDIIRCNFTFEGWDDFPARLAIFQSKAQRKAWVSSLLNDSCLIPWEALTRAGEVQVALVGTNTDGQVQRTETKTVVLQKQTLQGGVNSIDPTPDQYAQFIAQVEEIIGQAGVLSVNGMTGVVTLTYSDVGALPDSTTIPTKTSQLQNDSGFITSAPVTSVNNKTGAVNLTASDVGALPDSTVIPTKTSDLVNDSNFVSDASYVHTDNNFTTAEKNKLAGIEAGAEVNDVTSVNGQTGAVLLDAGDISCDDSQFLLIQASDVQDAIENLDYEANYILSIKQDTLVSGTNIKTINSQSILGGGDLSLATLPTVSSSDNGKVLQVANGSWSVSTLSTATTSADGLMSSTDKQHLEAVYADYSSALTALGV